MAEHAPPTVPADGVVEHASVRYEHSDVEAGGVMVFALGLIATLIVVSLLLWGLFVLFSNRETARKKTTLSPAAVDADNQLPEPRPEQIEDVRDGKVSLWPARARDYLAPQEQRLEQGDKKAGALKIDDAMKELSGKLEVRPKRPAAATRPPNQAASGRPISEKGGP